MTARELYDYVRGGNWSEEKWKVAEAAGLAAFRTFEHKEWDGKQAKNVSKETTRWVLTDAGLDLYLEACKDQPRD